MQGVGNVSFEREFVRPLNFVDVLYVPGLTKNFISVSTLEDKGYQVKFCDRVYIRPKGSDRSLDRVIGRRSGKVCRLHFEPTKALVISNISSQGELWNRRMAHLHHGALRHLRKAITGVPQVHEEKHSHCKSCALGKNIRKPFPQSEHKSKEPLDLLGAFGCMRTYECPFVQWL